jgi:hypothetical protein
MPEKTTAGSKDKYRPRRLLNPRRIQSLLKRAHEVMMADARNPQLTAQEKLEYLKTGAEYAKLLAAAEKQRRTEGKAKRTADKKLVFSAGKSPFED